AILDVFAKGRELGFSGLVTGILEVDGNVAMPRIEKLMIAAGSLQVTFHRAFDMCANPLNALKKLADLGIARVLTSGQKSDAAQGLTKIMELIAQPGAPIIMAGAGVRASNLSLFLDAGVQEVHSSAGVWLASPMRYRNSGLSMSSDAQADEYSRYAVDGTAVAEMKAIIAHHQAN
ncbi:copper homeostasis protein CutC, partial [Citrobacter portucalensis]